MVGLMFLHLGAYNNFESKKLINEEASNDLSLGVIVSFCQINQRVFLYSA